MALSSSTLGSSELTEYCKKFHCDKLYDPSKPTKTADGTPYMMCKDITTEHTRFCTFNPEQCIDIKCTNTSGNLSSDFKGSNKEYCSNSQNDDQRSSIFWNPGSKKCTIPSPEKWAPI